ncbi:hypothetical protein BASA83_012711 [Batrachochytrium salamandrivorans]|nr:hypothetical protein BASA83_012711 [Batrachochytrium salamandrivorans]
MRVKALVVAAMVITSVNAGGCGGLWSCFKGICGSKSGSSQDPPRQNLCTSRSLDYIKKEPSGDLGDDKTALFCSGMAFNLEKLQNRILNLAKSFDNQLPFLHDITDEMAHWETTQNRGTSKKHRKDGAKVQNTKELMNPSEKYLKAKTDLQDTRHYLGRWNDSYYRFWSVFINDAI